MEATNRSVQDNRKKANAYFVKEIMDALPHELLFKVYDFAITHCQKHDVEKTNRAISELINALNFEDEETRELSTSLLQLYQFAQEQVRRGNFDMAMKVLSGLRETWQELFESLFNSTPTAKAN
jgi:flagellin-specific chaperone FliS